MHSCMDLLGTFDKIPLPVYHNFLFDASRSSNYHLNVYWWKTPWSTGLTVWKSKIVEIAQKSSQTNLDRYVVTGYVCWLCQINWQPSLFSHEVSSTGSWKYTQETLWNLPFRIWISTWWCGWRMLLVVSQVCKTVKKSFMIPVKLLSQCQYHSIHDD
jgi:hypothetical protein